jgi:hypothetical protein
MVAVMATLAYQSPLQAGFVLGLGNYTSLNLGLFTPRTTFNNGNGENAVNGVMPVSTSFAQTFHTQTIQNIANVGFAIGTNGGSQTYTLASTSLSFDYNLKRVDGGGYHAYVGMRNLTKFTVTADSLYNLTSSYSLTANPNLPGSSLVLKDTSTNTNLVSNSGSSFTGSFLLLAGRTYALSYDYSVGGVGPQSITTGSYSLSEATQAGGEVPEPATIALWGIGALGMGLVVHRKKKLA